MTGHAAGSIRRRRAPHLGRAPRTRPAAGAADPEFGGAGTPEYLALVSGGTGAGPELGLLAVAWVGIRRAAGWLGRVLTRR